MTPKQIELLTQLAKTYDALAEECTNDEKFHNIMIDNNRLFPMSLDEMAAEWYGVIERNEE